MSAIQSALRTEDILTEIFDYLAPPARHSSSRYVHRPSLESQRTLYAAARTCKAFCRPALKILWAHVHTTDALFYVLHSSVDAVSDATTLDVKHKCSGWSAPKEAWIIDKPVGNRERERLLWYARFIRTINLEEPSRVDPSVFVRLSRENLGGPLAPRLHTITCNEHWPHLDKAVSLLAGPALRTLLYTFPDPSYVFTIGGMRRPLNSSGSNARKSLLKAVCETAPNLEHLKVEMCTQAHLLCPISNMQKLRSLDLAWSWVPIEMNLLRALASFEQLEELSLSAASCEVDIMPCRGFKSVKTLEIHGDLKLVLRLFAALPDLCLRELRLTNTFSTDLQSFPSLVASLTPDSRRSLESVRVTDTLPDVRTPPANTFVAPFLALPNIRSFVLDRHDAVCMNDQDLHAFGTAWPKLSELHLLSETIYTYHESVAPTVRGIIALTNLCPELRHVHISAVIPVLTSTPGQESPVLPYRSESVRKLLLDIQVDDDDIRDEHQVACVLWSVFRGLCIADLDRTKYKKWANVVDEVARMQEEWEQGYTSHWCLC